MTFSKLTAVQSHIESKGITSLAVFPVFTISIKKHTAQLIIAAIKKNPRNDIFIRNITRENELVHHKKPHTLESRFEPAFLIFLVPFMKQVEQHVKTFPTQHVIIQRCALRHEMGIAS